MTTNRQFLANAGFVNVDELIAAAFKTGVPLWIAAAFVERESKGQNIYGHDAGGAFNGAGAVTEKNYAVFYDLVINKHGRSNGVGPMQITWPGFLTDASRRGIKLWDPTDNYVYGLGLIAGYLSHDYSHASIVNAGTRYNGATVYGLRVADAAARWHGVLVPTVAPSTGVLHVGSHGAVIRNLQLSLNKVFPAYSHLAVDGVFGPATERVIVQAQTRFGIRPDGVIGPITRSKLNSVGVTF